MTDFVQRIAGVFVVGFLPLAGLIPLFDTIQNEQVTAVLGLGILAWLVYANAWSKRAVALYNAECMSWVSAYGQARVYLTADIMTKLAFLPVIGCIFDRWIHRNDPSHGDDREIKTTPEEP